MNVVVTSRGSDAVSSVIWFWSFYLVFVVCVDRKILDVSSPPNRQLRNNECPNSFCAFGEVGRENDRDDDEKGRESKDLTIKSAEGESDLRDLGHYV